MRYTIRNFLYHFCLILILTVPIAQAQSDSLDNHRFGFRLGTNYTIWIPTQDKTRFEFDNEFDFSAGFIYQRRLNNQFLLNFELFFTGKIFRVEYFIFYPTELNYHKISREEICFIVQVPILINYQLSGSQQKGFRVLAGPSIGVITRLWLYQGSNRFNSIWGVILGTEYQYSHFLVGLRCDFNLHEAYYSDYGNTIFRGKINTLSLTVGMVF